MDCGAAAEEDYESVVCGCEVGTVGVDEVEASWAVDCVDVVDCW